MEALRLEGIPCRRPHRVADLATVPCVVLAEDDAALRLMLAGELTRSGFDVIECSDGIALLELLASRHSRGDSMATGLIVVDNCLPGVTGLEVLDWLRRREVNVPVVLMTAFGSIDMRIEAASLGVAAFVEKPFDPETLSCIARSIAGSGAEAR